MIVVRLLRKGRTLRTCSFEKDEVTLGSASACDVRISGVADVQPVHITIYKDAEDITVVPADGAVVTLRGEPIGVAVAAKDDVFSAGHVTFAVSSENEGDLASDACCAQPGPDSTPFSDRHPDPTVDIQSGSDAPTRPQADRPKTPRQTVQTTRPPHQKAATLARTDDNTIPEPEPRPAPETVHTGHTKPDMAPGLSTTPVPSSHSQDALGAVTADARDLEDTAPQIATRDPTNRSVPHAPGGAQWEPPGATPVPDAPFPHGDEYYFSEDIGDELSFVEPFDLTEALLDPLRRLDGRAPLPARYCAARINRVVVGKLAESVGLLPGSTYISPAGDIRCKARAKSLRIAASPSVTGQHVSGATVRSFENARLSFGKRRVALEPNDRVTLQGSHCTYHIELEPAPAIPVSSTPEGSLPKRLLARADPALARAAGIAVAAHFAAIVLVSLTLPILDFTAEDASQEKFVEIVLEEESPAEDKKTPKKKRKVRVREEPQVLRMAEKAPRVNSRVWKKIKTRPKRQRSDGRARVGSLLKVLSAGSGKSGATGNIKNLVSNIDAVKAVTSSGGGFSVAGAIAHLPGKKVNLARSGDGGVVSTMSGALVAAKGSGIGRIGSARAGGGVRGTVTKMTSSAKVAGSLSRSEVLQVINSHLHEVQACYERALGGGKTLGGRVVFEWVVDANGKARSVRVRTSTLGNPKVSNCIRSKISSWRFPRPRGGNVSISFPFLFRSVSS